ncbi:MAG: methyltransferase domain-containing protein [Burkholderiales bacterium]
MSAGSAHTACSRTWRAVRARACASALGLVLTAGAAAQGVEIAAPYVPTASSVVERMLEIAEVGPGDYVIDLGSGDGRIVIAAASKHGARGLGIEIDPQLIALAQRNARAAGVEDRVRFLQADLFAADLSRATVVTIYLLKRATMKLRDDLLRLKPGTRIVSHAASMGDWPPDHFEMLKVPDRVRPDAPRQTYLHYWIVPAAAAGAWRWRAAFGGIVRDYELSLQQSFQTLSGTVRIGHRQAKIADGRLRGESVTLSFDAALDGGIVRHQLTGRVTGDSIEGTLQLVAGADRTELPWRASRATTP